MAKSKKNVFPLPDSPETAKENYDSFAAETPGDFLFDKQALLDMAEDAIAQRESFSYDPNADAMYRQYRDQYTRQGKQAMEDTMGVAAALNGGYGSSYGVTAGQQAYQSYLQRLTEVLPELYRLAYEKYADEGQVLQARYDALVKERNQDYAAHQDAWSRYNADKEDLYSIYKNSLSQRDALYDRLYNLIFQGYSPTRAEVAAAGMNPAIVLALQESWQRQQWQAGG